MSRPLPVDPYIDPSSGILRNLLNKQDAESLALAEANIVAIRDADLIRNPIPGSFGRIHLCAIHRSLFRDIYDWAGEPRTVNIDKGIPFAPLEHLDAALDDLQPLVVRHGYLHDLDLEATAEALTEIYGHINACHPFREGNGRTQRAFVRQLAAEAGWEVRWEDPAALANDQASFLDLAGKSDELNAMFTTLLFRLPA